MQVPDHFILVQAFGQRPNMKAAIIFSLCYVLFAFALVQWILTSPTSCPFCALHMPRVGTQWLTIANGERACER